MDLLSASSVTPQTEWPFNWTLSTESRLEEDTSEVQRLKSLQRLVKDWYIWIIFAFGFPGNLLSLYVIVPRRHAFGSPALYVATLAMVDNLAIAVKLALLLIGKYQVDIGHAGCKAFFFLGNHLVVYANWVLITMAVERFVAIWHPLKLARLWTARKACWTLALVLVVTLLLHVPFLFAFHARYTSAGQFIDCAVHNTAFMVVWSSAQGLAYGPLPCLLLLTLNVLILVLISRARRFQRSMQSACYGEVRAARKSGTDVTRAPTRGSLIASASKSALAGVQCQATILLLVTSFMLIVLTTPISVYMLVYPAWQPVTGTAETEHKRLLALLLRALCDFNHAVNFYLYFISAKNFRAYVTRAICELSPCCRTGQAVKPTTDRYALSSGSVRTLRDRSSLGRTFFSSQRRDTPPRRQGPAEETKGLTQPHRARSSSRGARPSCDRLTGGTLSSLAIDHGPPSDQTETSERAIELEEQARSPT